METKLNVKNVDKSRLTVSFPSLSWQAPIFIDTRVRDKRNNIGYNNTRVIELSIQTPIHFLI